MKPRIRIAAARTPSGGEIALYEHDRDFSITINGHDLMHSRQHDSEMALARLGCAHLVDRRAPGILIGGLGMGYTLRQALDMLGPQARVVVGELLGVVVEWNRRFLGVLNDQPLEDRRVKIEMGDIVDLIAGSEGRYDAILLDIDNGPSALTDPCNNRLYGHEGLRACRRALREQGCLAVWSSEASRDFEQLMMLNSFHVRRFKVPTQKGRKSRSCFIWVASEDKNNLPRGGSEPRLQNKSASKEYRRRPPKRG
jgi:spermidine synthase